MIGVKLGLGKLEKLGELAPPHYINLKSAT